MTCWTHVRCGRRDRAFIADYVDRYSAGSPPSVIEKTVGNTLRVPYVASVLPDATFVHLVRNGIDVAESTMRQWREPADYRYLARKVRHFPLAHAADLRSRVRRVPAPPPRLRRRAGVQLGAALPGHRRRPPQRETCSRSARGSGASRSCERPRDLETVDAPVIQVRYEDLVDRPREVLARVADFCSLSATDAELAQAAGRVSARPSGPRIPLAGRRPAGHARRRDRRGDGRAGLSPAPARDRRREG